MKALLFIGLLFISAAASSQVYLIIDPGVRRAGLMYNQSFIKHRIGVYSKCQYGIIDITDFYTQSIKAGAGLSYRMNSGGRLYFGLNFNYYFKTVDESSFIDLRLTKPVSIDVGISSGNDIRLRILFITDPINWETSIGLGYRFN